MTQSQTGIKVKDLQNASTLSNTASILALTDATNNTVNLVSKNDFSDSLVSSTANNGLSNDENGLFVPNIGNLADLDTTDKTSIVNAINENATNIGDLSNLDTTAKNNLVNAINENTAIIKQPITTLQTSGTITLIDNSINKIQPTGNITFNLPSVSDLTVFHQILIQVNLTTVYSFNFGTSYYFNEDAPDLSTTGTYNIIYEYDAAANHWVIGAIKKGSA